MRFVRYFVLLVATVLWAGGLSNTVAHWLYEIGVIVDDYRFGDLYRLSALPQFRDPAVTCPADQRGSDTSATHLYLIGDSFSLKLRRSDFAASHYQRAAWDSRQRAQLDPAKRNVLILESVERHVREHFARSVNELIIETDTVKTMASSSVMVQHLRDELHWSDVEERLESSLFSHDWAFWFKELKAGITLNWFGRTSTGVSLSRNGQNIFLNLDTDTTKIKYSSFAPLPDREVNALVDSINATAMHYRGLGFAVVYLSLIPNKASILEPNRGRYNHLIERIQQHPRLQVPVIDTYTAFKTVRTSPYLVGDTHWNCTGRQIWLDLARKKAHL